MPKIIGNDSSVSLPIQIAARTDFVKIEEAMNLWYLGTVQGVTAEPASVAAYLKRWRGPIYAEQTPTQPQPEGMLWIKPSSRAVSFWDGATWINISTGTGTITDTGEMPFQGTMLPTMSWPPGTSGMDKWSLRGIGKSISLSLQTSILFAGPVETGQMSVYSPIVSLYSVNLDGNGAPILDNRLHLPPSYQVLLDIDFNWSIIMDLAGNLTVKYSQPISPGRTAILPPFTIDWRIS